MSSAASTGTATSTGPPPTAGSRCPSASIPLPPATGGSARGEALRGPAAVRTKVSRGWTRRSGAPGVAG
eukprot:5739888-Alexandrium_andersonii.AAC.1